MNSNLTLIMGLILYLSLGILSDILISAYTLFVGKGQRFPASLTSSLVSFVYLVVIVKFFNINPLLYNIAAYSLGTGIGTYLLMTVSKHLKQQ